MIPKSSRPILARVASKEAPTPVTDGSAKRESTERKPWSFYVSVPAENMLLRYEDGRQTECATGCMVAVALLEAEASGAEVLI